MVSFSAVINKYKSMGEKTGWSYIDVAVDIAENLNPGNKKSFRVKGYLDAVYIEDVSLVPMGEGHYILPLKKDLRKALKKESGATVAVQIERDCQTWAPPAEFATCLGDEPAAATYFETLTVGHKRYFVNWIYSAKTEATQTKRLAIAINALAQQMDFASMLKAQKQRNELLK